MADWIEWNGGERPVGWEDIVEVRFRDGTTDISMAGDFCPLIPPSNAHNDNWVHGDSMDDIIAYRVVEKANDREANS
jgi:hypothetical protein